MYLTKRQKQILDYIGEYFAARGYAPTLEEIGEHFGLSSPATVYKHVQKLVEKGYLRKTKHQGRGIEVVEASPERTIEVSLLGTLRLGRRIEPVRPPELVCLPPTFRGRAPLFALRVRGITPEGAELQDGDLIVLEDRRPRREDESVLVMLNGRLPAFGHTFRDDDDLWVRYADGSRSDIGETDNEIRGVLVGLIRDYR
jgi:repressor LexA